LEIGELWASGFEAEGQIIRGAFRTTIDGTLVADINPEHAHGDVTQYYSSTTGELWTINQSAATTNDPTWTGEGLDFDGTDDYVVTPYTPAAQTLSLFAATPPANTDLGQIVSNLTNAPDQEGAGLFIFSDENIRAYLGNGSSGNSGVGASPAVNGLTDSLVSFGTWDDGTQSVYAYGDGVLGTGTSTPAGSPDITTSAIHIGSAADLGGAYDGVISLAGINSSVLSTAEVAQNFRAIKHLLAQRGVDV